MAGYPMLNKNQIALLIEKLSKEYGHGYGGGQIITHGSWTVPSYFLEAEKSGREPTRWIPCIASSLSISNDQVASVARLAPDYVDLMVLFPKELTGSESLGQAKIYQTRPKQDTYFLGEKSGQTTPVMVKCRIYYKDIRGVADANGRFFGYEGFKPLNRSP